MNGYVAAQADRVGIPIPTHSVDPALAKCIEHGQLALSPASLEAL
jgi:hypothetical protein